MNELPQPRSFAALALDLPSSRMSVDFTNFTISQPQPQENAKRKLPVTSLVSQQITRKPIARSVPLPNVQEKPEPASNTSSQKSHRWLWSRQQPHEREIPVSLLSRTNSSASIASSNSNASTAASSVFSRDQSVSTSRTSLASVDFETPRSSQKKEPVGLSSLPLSLLESILAYALCLPLTVAIGPQSSERRHMQYRYHRAGLDYIDIQLIRKHPLFLVSHHIREVSLDVFNQKCDFVIDLHRIYHTKVASTMNDNLRLYEKFWVTEKPPKMVTDTLKSLYRLNLRLPVPSCENSGHRGRDEDDWVDGSDGQGGGNWRLKSMKREQEDAARVLQCLDSIMKLVMVEPAPKEIRGRAGSLSRTTSLKRSFSRSRSKSRGHVSERSDSKMAKEEQNKRQLKRLEVTLVKKNSYVMVLPDTLGLVKLLRAIPVGGFTKYYFELEEQQVLWATKHRKKWKGFEPDGTRLLNGMYRTHHIRML